MIQAIRDDAELYGAILAELRKRDLAGLFKDEVVPEPVAADPVKAQ